MLAVADASPLGRRMKRTIEILGRALGLACFALACLVVSGALGLLVLEKSGWLAEWVRAEARGQLAAGGTEFDLEELELDWFAPAVILHGISLGPDGRMARIQQVRLTLAPLASRSKRLRHVTIAGGRVRLSADLLETLARLRLAAGHPLAASGAMESVDDYPPLTLSGVQFDLVHPTFGDFPLGALDAAFGPDAHGRANLRGVLSPSLADPGNRAAMVYMDGHIDRPGVLLLHLSTAGFPISTAALPPGEEFDRFRALQPTGTLALDARAELSLDTNLPTTVDLRARLTDGSLTRDASKLALRELAFDVEADYRREVGRDWSDARTWNVLAQGRGRWRDSELSVFTRVGRAAGPARLLSAELRLANCDVSPEAVAELGFWEEARPGFEAISPMGRADVAVAAAMDHEGTWSAALDARLKGELSASYTGWPSQTGTGRDGFPLPVKQLRGRVCAAFDPSQPRAFQLGLMDVTCEPIDEGRGQAKAWVRGLIVAPTSASPLPKYPDFVLDFSAKELAIGVPARRALESIANTDWIWPAFRPSAGVVDGSGRLMSDWGNGGVSGHFEIRPRDLQVTWDGLPIPLDRAAGRIDLHFDPRGLFGITFDVAGNTPTAEHARVLGRVQQDPALAPPLRTKEHPLHPPVPESSMLMDFDVAVRGMALRGTDRDVIATTWPGVGTALDLFQPSGKADVSVRVARARAGEELAFRVEVEPRQVQLTPTSFSTPTRNVQGRVLVSGSQSSGSETGSFVTRIAPLIGEWPQEARVACSAVFSTDGGDHIEVQGAGIDLTNRGLVGAFREAFAGGSGGGFDLKALSIDGRIDFSAEVSGPTAAPGAPGGESVYRVFLRDNSFRTDAAGSFGLSGLWGQLVQREGILTGERIQARLGSTAVSLSDVRFLEERGVARFSSALHARGLPIDREHLALFLDPDTVKAAIDHLHLSGWIDFENARIEYTGKTELADPKVALSGDVRPRDAFVDLGLPLSIDRARVDLSELVLEGGHVRAWAKVTELDGAIANRKLEGARMLVTYVEPRLSILDLSGNLEGGRIGDLAQFGSENEGSRARATGPAFTMDLLDPFRFELGLALRDVQLGGLLRGMFQSEFADTGYLDAQIRLDGDLERLTEIVGDGWVRLRDTRLWSIPVVRDLLSQLGMDSSAVFERMQSRVSLKGGVIHMDAIHVQSPILELVGAGILDLDGRLEHDLEARFALVDSLGPLTRLVYWIQNNLLSVSVRGDMSRPQIVLKGVLSLLQSTNGKGRELPLPPLTPLPARF